MTVAERAVVAWSSGKDCAWALDTVRRTGQFDVVGLLTTVTETFQRVSMHGVRLEVLEAQARAVGLPLHLVSIPFPCPNEVYERAMGRALTALRVQHVERVVFGDLFLEDVRRYREERMAHTGLAPAFPLWGRSTPDLVREMISAGLEARIVALDPSRVPPRFAGRVLTRPLLEELPPEVDPCGERGEFHTCVTAGPMFDHPLPVEPGDVVERDGFVFADVRMAPLRPASPGR